MGVKEHRLDRLARQLGRPHGIGGLLVGRMLNRLNAPAITDAVTALALGSGATAADLGFGGGLGLELLLKRVGAGGHVYGSDISTTMVRKARRRFRTEIRDGRLHLDGSSLTALALPAAAVDGLITLNTIYFVDDLAAVLEEIRRVLRDGGRAVIGLGDPDAMAKDPLTSRGFRLRPVAEVVDEAERAGLVMLEHRQIGRAGRTYNLLVLGPQKPDGISQN